MHRSWIRIIEAHWKRTYFFMANSITVDWTSLWYGIQMSAVKEENKLIKKCQVFPWVAQKMPYIRHVLNRSTLQNSKIK